jgi:HD-GYP domain-containing protein (c-di-GMP phosphodiesterase class II)
LLRLCGMTFAIAIVLAALAYYVERGRVLDSVMFNTQQQVRLFNAQILHIFDDARQVDSEVLQWELDMFAQSRTQRENGKFVIVRIVDMTAQPLAELNDKSSPYLEPARAELAQWIDTVPPTTNGTRDAIHLMGDLQIRVSLPLADRTGKVVAHVAGIFALSKESIAGIQQRTLRTTALVIVIVLLTAGLLYPVIVTLTSRLSRFSEALLDANLETLQALGGAIAKRDSDTNAHNYRVTILSVRIAEAVELDPATIQGLIKGAFLHDVGKIAIRDAVLLKPGRLDEQEFEHMKTHVLHGTEIVNRSSWLTDAQDVVEFHHEKFDGSGYDAGLEGEAIPIVARIFAIADVFDALTSRRPYKEPFSFEQAVEILEEGRASHFDPALLDAFFNIARAQYDHLADRDEETPREELGKILRQYFSGGLEQMA